MADENISIAVTDDGTIDAVVALLQLLGLTAEEAAARASSGFVNMSQSQQVAANSARILGAAANAQFESINQLRDATDQLTTSEQKAASTVDGAARLTTLLAEAQQNGYGAALQLKSALDAQAAAGDKAVQSFTAQGDAVEGLTRLQQNLAAREQELTNAFLLTVSSTNTYTTAQNNAAAATSSSVVRMDDAIASLNAYERAQVQLGISIQGLYGTYQAQDTLFGAQAAEAAGAARELASLGVAATETAGAFSVLDRAQLAAAASAQADSTSFAAMAGAAEQRLAASRALSVAQDGLVAADQRAAAAVTEFIALQRECNTTTIAGRDAIAQATIAYNTAVDAVGALAVEQEIAASSIGKLADSALKMADGLRSAAAASVALDTAEEAAIATTGVLSVSLTRIQTIGKDLYGTFGGLNAIFAGAFAVGEIVKASDAFTKIGTSLQTVTHNAQEFNSVYSQIRELSNATQTSLESNVKLYVQFADATKTANIGANDLIKAVGGIDTALKLGNVTGQDAYRVMRSFQEALSTTSGSAERFFQNLQRESPTAYALFSAAAVKAGVDLKEFGGENTNAADKVSKLKDKADQLQSKLDGSTKSVGALSNQLSTTSRNIDNASTSAEKFTNILDAGGKLTDAQRVAYEKLNDKIDQNYTLNGKAAAQLGIAKDKQDQLTQSAIKRNAAELATAETQADSTKRVQDFIRVAEQLYADNGALATQFTTVSGALTVLKNNLVDFAGTSNTASASMQILKDVILLAANNLGIIIPLVVGFGAAIAVLKIVETTSKIVELTSATLKLGSAFLITNAPLIAFAALVVGLVIVFEKFANALHLTQEPLDTFGSLMSIAQAGAGLFGQAVEGLSAKITNNAIHTQASTDAHKALQNAQIGTSGSTSNLGDAISGTDKKVVEFTVHNDAATLGLSKNSTTTSDASKAYVAAQKAIADTNAALTTSVAVTNDSTQAVTTNSAQLATLKAKQDDATTAQLKLNDAVKSAPSLWASLKDAIAGVISKLGDYLSTAAQAASAAAKSLLGGTSTPTAAGHARDGGSFTVAGTGPVDSKLIAVSPGEVVTVQTPAQYRAGVRPPITAGQTHFATGGVTTGFGVSLGTGASLEASGSPIGNSVTGYDGAQSSAVGALTTATNANVSTTTANTSATASDSAATSNNSAVVTANTTALATLTTSNTSNTSATVASTQATASAANATVNAANNTVSELKENTAAGTKASTAIVTASNDNVKADNENTKELGINTTALSDASKNIVAGANAIVTADNALQTTLASAANAIVSAANTMASASKSSASSTTQSTATTTSSSMASSNNTSTLDPKNTNPNKYTTAQYEADAEAGKVSADGRMIIGASGTIYKATGSSTGPITGWQTSTGIKIQVGGGGSSVSNTYSDVISSQYKAQQTSMSEALTATANAITASNANYKDLGGNTSYNMGSGLTTNTDAIEANKKVAAMLTAQASAIKARDGADFYVPGGTGVDSKHIQLAVSPGEQVTVRTPAQQQDANNTSNGGNVYMTVYAQDAQSFGSSQAQTEVKMVRALRRANRR